MSVNGRPVWPGRHVAEAHRILIVPGRPRELSEIRAQAALLGLEDSTGVVSHHRHDALIPAGTPQVARAVNRMHPGVHQLRRIADVMQPARRRQEVAVQAAVGAKTFRFAPDCREVLPSPAQRSDQSKGLGARSVQYFRHSANASATRGSQSRAAPTRGPRAVGHTRFTLGRRKGPSCSVPIIRYWAYVRYAINRHEPAA